MMRDRIEEKEQNTHNNNNENMKYQKIDFIFYFIKKCDDDVV